MPVNKMFNLFRSILSESMLLYKWTTLLLLLYPIKISRANLPGKKILLILFNLLQLDILHFAQKKCCLVINKLVHIDFDNLRRYLTNMEKNRLFQKF